MSETGYSNTSAILVTHGGLAQALIDTARAVLGNVDNCYAVSNEQKSPGALRGELDDIIAAAGADTGFVVFVDFFGGSCCHTCIGLEQDHDNVRLISGVNLPMLLAFLNKRAEVPFEHLPAEIVSRGHNSVKLVQMDEL